MDFEEDFGLIVFIIMLFIALGFSMGFGISGTVEIQEIKQVDEGYYITINDEIYYKEV
jgi:hypothetical protein